MKSDDVIDRVAGRISRPVATMVVEDGSDRHFIGEITLAAVATYLLMKYVDGFVEGLGIKELGKKHGRAIAKLLSTSDSMIREAVDEAEADEAAARLRDGLAGILADLSAHASDDRARSSAEHAVKAVLVQKDVPEKQAESVASEIGEEVFGRNDG